MRIKNLSLRVVMLLSALIFSAYAAALAQDDREFETRDRGAIRFARGQSSALVRGGIRRDVRDQYSIRARAGQLMTIRFESGDPRAGFDVYAAAGLEALPVTAADELRREWSGRLPAGDEYYINVLTDGAGGDYSFEVRIENAPPRERETPPAAPVAKEFRPVLAKLKGEARAPVLLPAELPAELDRPIYVNAGGSEAGYDITLALRPRCGANACSLGFFSAERGGALAEEFERVELVNGVRGAYKPLTCGASCSPPIVEWVQDGVLYTIQLKLNYGSDEKDRAALVQLANSSIQAGAR